MSQSSMVFEEPKRCCTTCASYYVDSEGEYGGGTVYESCSHNQENEANLRFPFEVAPDCYRLNFWLSEFTELIDGTIESHDEAYRQYEQKYPPVEHGKPRPIVDQLPLVLYHGTSSNHFDSIREKGLDSPYLTSDPDIAAYYAECATDEEGGDDMILQVRITNTSLLRYDGAAMDEPVMVDEEVRDAAWEKAGKDNPGWLKGDYIVCPPEAWQVSLAGVKSVRFDGDIAPHLIDEY